MGLRRKDMTGKKFGKLRVISFSHVSNGAYWNCMCDCGKTKKVSGNSMRMGRSRSCGCINGRHDKTEMLGKKFGSLTTIRYIPSETDQCATWECRCTCGKIKVVKTTYLKARNNVNCGCKSRLKKKIGEAQFNTLFYQYTRSAKRRGFSWSLSKKKFKELTKTNCYYCNIPPSKVKRTKYSNGAYIFNGIDRLNNKLGYSLKNCVSCCSDCNYMKSDINVDKFLNKIAQIFKHKKLT